MTSHDRIPCVYVTGVAYCGSTLLAFLLNTHPRMASISEAAGPVFANGGGDYRCSCGAPLLQCGFYRELERRINAYGSTFDLSDWRTQFQLSRRRLLDIPLVRPLRNASLERVRDGLVSLSPGYRKKIGEIARRNAHLARGVLELSGKDVFVDAQKDPIRVKFLQESKLFDLWVIHLVRDVRGSVNSYLRHQEDREKNSAAAAARYWRTANMNSERARRYVPPERWLRLLYDDLCADVRGTMDRIADFAGVERAPVPEDFYAVEHHVIGNVMRLRKNAKIERDDSWRAALSPDDLEIIAKIAGGANRYFGYTWPE